VSAELGPSNFFNIHPYAKLRARRDLLIDIDANLFWRLERADGVYAPQATLLRPARGASERFVDIALTGIADWTPRPGLLLSLVYTRSSRKPSSARPALQTLPISSRPRCSSRSDGALRAPM